MPAQPCTRSSTNQRKLGSGGAPRHTKAMDASPAALFSRSCDSRLAVRV